MENLPEIKLPRAPKGLRFDVQAIADPVFAVNADSSTPTISIFAVIGLDVTAQRIAGALRAIGNRPLTAQINSPGGDYYEGIAIYNLFRQHPQPVTVQVLGIAASAASIIAMAGNRIEMARNADIMIHRAKSIAMGDAALMIDAADFLEKLDAAMAKTYAARTGLPLDQITAMMAAETYLPSDEALNLGFADALLAQDAAPQPRRLESAAAHSKIEFETQLRGMGFARAAAARLAAGGWPALAGAAGEATDLDQIIARLAANTDEIKALR
ncbi:MAG: Clp protease ClpP [Rhizobiales bacterium]|nr:Clp protease ClpP [Hyphomicrobiales bacterium]